MKDKLPIVCCITATSGRHRCVERVTRFMLDQDYEGKYYHLIYNNSCENQELSEELPSNFILVNNCTNTETNSKYENLGQIYRDAIRYVPEDVEVVNFADDDDIFLPNHISAGVSGLINTGKTAYKPAMSYYKDKGRFVKMVNTFEPSIFVKFEHVKRYGFSDKTTEQHLQWVHPLIDSGEIISDPNGASTLIYDWSQEIGTFKTSGNPNNPKNFDNYRRMSVDHGDKVISPISKSIAEKYYKIRPTNVT